MMAISGCAAGKAAEVSAQPSPPAAAPPSASPATSIEAAKLRAALLPTPKGMTLAYGPEIGAFGLLKSTKQGLDAVRQAKLDRPECAGAAQLDAAKPEIGNAPAAVVAFSSDRGSITQALIAMPKPAFPAPLPAQCNAYGADVRGTRVMYRTRDLAMPERGDESRAYLTTASGGHRNAEVGSVVIRRGRVVMSMLVVGQKVKPVGLFELARLADQNLARITR
ncbi:hypothetical protein [Nonomuraea rhizosphaerae]|uniref:hypothetical protein n=1 Tax=Nonomuraea rhizosphaerae TaxID=2665663 RepID=UPI001C5F8CDF|nr:hypothetical protein [Nonomuraea rhizosphaerae]